MEEFTGTGFPFPIKVPLFWGNSRPGPNDMGVNLTDTYFIRHSSALDVDDATLDLLWNENWIAIHYPRDESGCFEEDSRSMDPRDYAGSGKSALERLHDLAKNGGYVFATYRGKPGGKAGWVEPGSSVEFFYGTWGGMNDLQGRQAILKAVRLRRVRNLAAEEAISLTTVQPRQGTFCRWRKVRQRVASIVEGTSNAVLGSLTPDLQEVMCMEYMRTEKARERGLPVLRYTLMPVGRTMKDVDILGVSESGEVLSAQVTFEHLDRDGAKLSKLDPYRSEGGKTIYFCQCEGIESVKGHLVFPLQWVFQDFCIEDIEGREWFRLAVSG